MSSDDRRDGHGDDFPPPEALPDPGERGQAESFVRLVDRLLADEPLPPVMTSEERTLVEVAAVVRACTGEPRLDELRQRAIIDDVMARATRAAQPQLSVTPGPAAADGASPGAPERSNGPDGDRAGGGQSGRRGARGRWRGRVQRTLPWALTAASIAAALLLALRPPRAPARDEDATVQARQQRLDVVHRSRPADALVGEISRQRAGAASDRIDVIYADRLMGYRDLRLRGGRP